MFRGGKAFLLMEKSLAEGSVFIVWTRIYCKLFIIPFIALFCNTFIILFIFILDCLFNWLSNQIFYQLLGKAFILVFMFSKDPFNKLLIDSFHRFIDITILLIR